MGRGLAGADESPRTLKWRGGKGRAGGLTVGDPGRQKTMTGLEAPIDLDNPRPWKEHKASRAPRVSRGCVGAPGLTSQDLRPPQ